MAVANERMNDDDISFFARVALYETPKPVPICFDQADCKHYFFFPTIMLLSVAVIASSFLYNVVSATVESPVLDVTTIYNQQLMMDIMAKAASIASSFFSLFFRILYTVGSWIVWPLFCLMRGLWQSFIVKPVAWSMHLFYTFYPVIMFCFAAVACGLIIGGFAGFAAEAFSSILIAATWGAPAAKRNQLPATTSDQDGSIYSSDRENIEEDEEVQVLTMSSKSSVFESDREKDGFRTPTQRRPSTPLHQRTSPWRQPLSRRSSSSSASYFRPSRTLSSARKRFNSQETWHWSDEEEDDEFPSSLRSFQR
ncbi:uncharacterized protein BYT42DRAFT_614146 [Radiomyces spectabilis]|uniref:uncharacterized protein n=1 Tax=Radiomyces spectabilis TaxID=64574 RepID=UPI0022205784|nr:uncharacterized protein BYT42DRAFT_614146 [Radiomyces spectabilis]KAI8377462.1 hypothetical protein BYT42DRAFT_614146 [Radiomyces spectabilis]